jgi:Bacterial PH domain/Short C-terminal domain
MAKDDLRPDIAKAKDLMRVKLGGGKEIKRLVGHLWEDEHVERMTTGAYGAGTGLLVVTDRRLLFIKEGAMSKKSEDFPLEKVSSVQWSSGMVTGTITIFASGNKAEIKNVNKDDGKAITDLMRHRLSAPKPTATASSAAEAPTAAADIPDQIRKLGELRDAGVLTADEFEAKKAELLSRM